MVLGICAYGRHEPCGVLMSSLCSIVFALCMLGCTGKEESPSPEPPPPPAVSDNEAPGLQVAEEPGLEGYSYIPGSTGGAEGARFSHFDPGQTVYVGVDDANLRDDTGEVIARLRLGTKLQIVQAEGAPSIAIGRRNLWYTVEDPDSSIRGRLFGGLLTPFGGSYLPDPTGGELERGWAVSFSPEGRPRLRVDVAPGSDDAISLDINVTDRFEGGRMEASVVDWGDFETRFEVMLCRLDGGEAPSCSTAVVNRSGDALVQLTPPDPWQYELHSHQPMQCHGEGALSINLSSPLVRNSPEITLETPGYMRGSDGHSYCYSMGTDDRQRQLMSCVRNEPDKDGPSTVTVHYFLREDRVWTALPCASSGGYDSELASALVQQRIHVGLDTSIDHIIGLQMPQSLPVDHGSIELVRHAPRAAGGTVLFEHPEVGTVYGNSMELSVLRADGTALIYSWKPTMEWSDPSAVQGTYLSGTRGCGDGVYEIMINVEPGVSASDVRTITTLADGTPVGELSDPSHPVNQKYLEWYDGLRSLPESQRPPTLDVGLSAEAFLASQPWLFVPDPWGRMVRLMRSDLETPPMCEPIIYAYSDPPVEIHIAPQSPLHFFATRPHGPQGWSGIAQPDGSIVVDGLRWPELFWEGRSIWFDQPEGVVVAQAELSEFLMLALEHQGLTVREATAFIEAWLPDLTGHDSVFVGFHNQQTISAIAPLDISPEPDTFIRVMMDARFVEAEPTWDGEPPDLPQPPERTGLVVVEWGGVLR